MAYELITYATHDAVAVVTLNRPEKLNAWTPAMSVEQVDAIGRANADTQIGAIVLTGAGRGFCAGADMAATFQSRIDGKDPGADTMAGQGGMPAGLDWVRTLREAKPIVAAVNGAAVGIGLTMVLPCDVIVASTAAKLGMGFIKMGLVPELASTRLLVQRIGVGHASEMCLSGRLYPGDEAARIGLVDHLTSPEELLPRALAIAGSFAANPDLQLRMTKQLLTAHGLGPDLADVQEGESRLLRDCWKSAEHKEAVAAFLEKRPAKFR
ncbi:MAG TPA: enoyl-CoA hydratase-related protein [Candidatus Binatia bacterium]|jgi:enoyl-CoA hydratase/carnithine racemase|nr:enoyl-CoA hydratase-related protein [Candidatus Binatia bacterium]